MNNDKEEKSYWSWNWGTWLWFSLFTLAVISGRWDKNDKEDAAIQKEVNILKYNTTLADLYKKGCHPINIKYREESSPSVNLYVCEDEKENVVSVIIKDDKIQAMLSEHNKVLTEIYSKSLYAKEKGGE